MSDVKVRLSGLPDDVERLCQALRESGDQGRYQVVVLEESEDYANRGKSLFVRRYVTVEVREGEDALSA